MVYNGSGDSVLLCSIRTRTLDGSVLVPKFGGAD